MTTGEFDSAVDLVRSLLTARQRAPPDLLELAKRSRRWAASGLLPPPLLRVRVRVAGPPQAYLRP